MVLLEIEAVFILFFHVVAVVVSGTEIVDIVRQT